MSQDPLYRVLVVCSGNTCRSPLAAAALTQALGPDADKVEVISAGTAAWEGQPASPGAIHVARESGIDLSSHRSHRATPELVRSADLVLVMEPQHRRSVQSLGADPERTHVLSEWPAPGEPGLPVSDPYGGSQEAYEECWRRVRRHMERIVPHVREALRARSA